MDKDSYKSRVHRSFELISGQGWYFKTHTYIIIGFVTELSLQLEGGERE